MMYLYSFLLSFLLMRVQVYAQVVLKSNCEELEEAVPAAIDDIENCETYRSQCKSDTTCTGCETEYDGLYVSSLGCLDGCEYIWESQGVIYSVKRGIGANLADSLSGGGHIGQYRYVWEFADGMSGSYEIQVSVRGDYCFAFFNAMECTCQPESCGYQVDCSDIEGGIFMDCTYQIPEPNMNQKPMELLLAIPAFACASSNSPNPDNDNIETTNTKPPISDGDNSTETAECALACNNGVFNGVECESGYIPNQYNNGYDYTDVWGECHRNSCCAPDTSFCCMPEFEGSDCRFCPGTSFIINHFVLCPSGYIYDTSKVGNYYSRLVPTCDFNVCCTTDTSGTDCCIPEDHAPGDDSDTNPPSTIDLSPETPSPPDSDINCFEYCYKTIWTNVICDESESIAWSLFGNFTDSDGNCSYCACCAADIDECCLPAIPGMPISTVCPWSTTTTTGTTTAATTTTTTPTSANECTQYCKELSNKRRLWFWSGHDDDDEKLIWTNVSCEESGKVENKALFGNFMDSDDGSCSYNVCCAVDVDDCCIIKTTTLSANTAQPPAEKSGSEALPPKTIGTSNSSPSSIINAGGIVSILFVTTVI